MQVSKTIERLHIHFQKVHKPSQSSSKGLESGSNLLDASSLVYLFVVKCEDLESYKNTVKPALTTWVDRMNLHKNEWLVLYVPLGTQASTTASRGLSSFSQTFRDSSSNVYRKICDKMKSDFMGKNDKLDRICKIEVFEGTTVQGAAPGQQQQHEAQWSELILKVKSCIMEAFDARCSEYEAQLRLLDAKVFIKHMISFHEYHLS